MMLVYLDTNIVQYCADYGDIIFGECAPGDMDRKLLTELLAIKRLIDLERLGSWEFAAPRLLLNELHAGKPRSHQLEVYRLLEGANCLEEPDPDMIADVSRRLLPLALERKDRRQIATALVMGASWFLTNDNGIIKRTKGCVQIPEEYPLFRRGIPRCAGSRLLVARPSGCLPEISRGLFLSSF
jgi:hypothetical protein